MGTEKSVKCVFRSFVEPGQARTVQVPITRRANRNEQGGIFVWGDFPQYFSLNGESILIGGYHLDALEDDVCEALVADARACLKPHSRFEVIRLMPENFGRTLTMGWVANPVFATQEVWVAPEAPNYDATRGVYVCHRDTA